MIRVLQVVTHMNRGGLETMIMNYYRHIDRTQIQFDFLTHREYDGDYGEEIKQLGGKIYHLPILNPFSANYKKALRNFFQMHPEYQIIHVHQDCLSGVILSEAAHQSIPVRIAHSHNANQDKNIKYLIKRYYMRFIPQYATELFACSREAGDWMFRGANYIIVKNAIQVKDYCYSAKKRSQMRSELGIKQGEFVVGHVGRFSPQKNHTFLIDVFRHIRENEPNARLLLIGDNQDKDAEGIKEKVHSLNLENSVIFSGLRSDVPQLLQAMDVFVFPSLYEGLGIAAIEAQAAGLPCLISDRVPIECKLTPEVRQLPLEAPPETWAEQAIEAAKEPQRDTLDEIQAAGYDIESNAEWLQRFYLDAYKKSEGKR